jgi:hypothetical protein
MINTTETRVAANEPDSGPRFGRFTELCRDHRIPPSTGGELVRAGLLRPFKIGGRTFIELSEFDQLPQRMQDPAAQERLSAVRRRRIQTPISERHRKAGLASGEARRRKCRSAAGESR